MWGGCLPAPIATPHKSVRQTRHPARFNDPRALSRWRCERLTPVLTTTIIVSAERPDNRPTRPTEPLPVRQAPHNLSTVPNERACRAD
jgi:hypothetical protein